MSVIAASSLLVAISQVDPAIVLPKRAEPVPRVYWGCTLHTLEDLRIKISGDIDRIPASADKPIDPQSDVKTVIHVRDDSTGKLVGDHSANYFDLTRTVKTFASHDSGAYFLTLELAPPSGQSYAILSYTKPQSMAADDPIALGFCEHSSLDEEK
jgi:hypothetical protein